VSAAVAAVRARAVSLPVSFWLAFVVVASAGFRIALQSHIVAPWIMIDELIYSELSKSFAATGHFDVRGVASNGYGFVYPILIAPAWRLYSNVPQAYGAAKAINAIAMSLTAVPAYFLARRVVEPGLALATALLSVLVPSMLYSQMLMTENAFYPIFVLACLMLVLALERPTVRRQAGLLAVCAVAYATRAQAVALLPAIAVAPLLLGAAERDLRGRLRAFAPLYGIFAAGAVLILVATTARGRSPLSVLGAYRAATTTGYHAHTVATYLLWHVAELDLYLGVIPFAALVAMWLSIRSLPPAARAFAAASLPIVFFLVLEVATFATQTSVLRIEERNMFYVAPLAFVALFAVTAQVVPRRRVVYGAAAAVAGLLPGTFPFEHFITTSAVSDTFALMPWWWLQDHFLPMLDVRWGALLCGAAGAELFLILPRRWLGILPLIVAAYLVVTSAVVENGRHGIHVASVGTLWAGIRVQHPDWVDRAVGSGADVSFLWLGKLEPQAIWENEFFSRSVHTIYDLGGPSPGNLPEVPLHKAKDGRLVDTAGRVVRVHYALASTTADVEGKVVARDPKIGLDLVRVDGPLVLQTKIKGIYAGTAETWSGRTVTYSRFDCTGGRLSVQLQTDPHLYTFAQTVTARVAGRIVGVTHVAPTALQWLSVRLQPDAHRVCLVTFTAAHVLVPARVHPGSPDTRPLGAHFLRFDFVP
jgi:hypothetical protein